MISLGIESTAHTFGIGIVRAGKDTEILANIKGVYVPEKGGIHPIEAKEHHEKVKEKVLEDALQKAGIELPDTDLISYSAGPGLPPCLRTGLEFAKKLAKDKKMMEVNHCIAHIEIGRLTTKCNDPITLYVSGGNTQIIGFASGRYRVLARRRT
jgi:glycoprotease/Kae1 family metallohydrolase